MEAPCQPECPVARMQGQAQCMEPICLSSLPRALPAPVPVWMKPTTGDFRTRHWGRFSWPWCRAFNFRFPSPTPLTIQALSAPSPMWSYITLADTSHASPSHLDRKMRKEQDRTVLAERANGKLRTPGPYPP